MVFGPVVEDALDGMEVDHHKFLQRIGNLPIGLCAFLNERVCVLVSIIVPSVRARTLVCACVYLCVRVRVYVCI